MGADVNAQTLEGNTALRIAALTGNTQIVHVEDSCIRNFYEKVYSEPIASRQRQPSIGLRWNSLTSLFTYQSTNLHVKTTD